MTLTLHFHPLSSYCQKVLIGLYELELPFAKNCVDLADPVQRAALLELWPLGQFPVLRDEANQLTLPETTTILEYADRRLVPRPRLIPSDPERAAQVRHQDRFYDLYVNTPMGKIVTDKLRPAGQHDPFGVEQARSTLRTAYDIADARLEDWRWASGADFGLADCAAAPALFFAEKIMPFSETHPHLARYFERVLARPSVKRTLAEAAPYLALFPG